MDKNLQSPIIDLRRSIKNTLFYLQRIVYDVRIPEFVRIYKFTRTIRLVLSKFNINSNNVLELNKFKNILESVKRDIIDTCHSYGVYDY